MVHYWTVLAEKSPFLPVLSLYVIASLGCAAAHSVDALIGLRFLQALGGCAGMVASRAMVRDLFDVSESAKMFSLLMLVVGISPIIAPTLGGYMAAHLHWSYIFITLTLMGICILAAVYWFLPDSRLPDKELSLHPRSIIPNFWRVFREPQFYTYAFTGSLASAGLYAYIAGSPYVFMELFKVSEKQYGWIFALIAMGLIVSSQLNRLMLKKFTSEAIIKRSLFFQSMTGLILFTGTYFAWLGLFSTIFFIFIFLCCQGFTFPNSSALSLAPFSRNAGSASALLGAIQMGIGAAVAAIVSYLSSSNALPMTGMMAFCATASFSILMIGRNIIRYRASVIEVEEQEVEMIGTS